MKRKIGIIIAAAASALLMLSCSKDNGPDYTPAYLNWIVTCKTAQDGKFYLQLDDKTTGLVENVSKPLYNGKQVRALASLTDKGPGPEGYDRLVAINAIDSIRTKAPVPTEGDLDDEKFGTAPVEIYRSWLTLVEDDYLNLCFQAL